MHRALGRRDQAAARLHLGEVVAQRKALERAGADLALHRGVDDARRQRTDAAPAWHPSAPRARGGRARPWWRSTRSSRRRACAPRRWRCAARDGRAACLRLPRRSRPSPPPHPPARTPPPASAGQPRSPPPRAPPHPPPAAPAAPSAAGCRRCSPAAPAAHRQSSRRARRLRARPPAPRCRQGRSPPRRACRHAARPARRCPCAPARAQGCRARAVHGYLRFRENAVSFILTVSMSSTLHPHRRAH